MLLLNRQAFGLIFFFFYTSQTQMGQDSGPPKKSKVKCCWCVSTWIGAKIRLYPHHWLISWHMSQSLRSTNDFLVRLHCVKNNANSLSFYCDAANTKFGQLWDTLLLKVGKIYCYQVRQQPLLICYPIHIPHMGWILKTWETKPSDAGARRSSAMYWAKFEMKLIEQFELQSKFSTVVPV